MTDETEKKLFNINWIHLISEEGRKECQEDAESYVLKSFWDHKKDCSNKVDGKVRNTAKAVRKMLQNRNSRVS